ncbi:MAG: molecular chaperone DnaJ [bacterium]
MAKRDYYEVLGIPKAATKQQLKSAYRKLAKEFHPDRNKASDAETKFKEVQEAYDILNDDQKRTAYDQYGHAGTQGFGGGSGGYGGFQDFGFDAGGIGDIFEQFFGGGFGGFSAGNSRRAVRGQDIGLKLNLSFDEAVFGSEQELKYNRKVECKSCGGTGAKAGSGNVTCSTCGGQGRVARVQQTFIGNIQTVTTCPDCHGTGKIIKDKCIDCNANGIVEIKDTFKIKVPHGIPDDVTLKFSGRGHVGKHGGSHGDLYIEVEVRQHETLERRGNDIYSETTIDAVDAVLGTTVEIDTVYGKDKLEIPSGTQPEAVLKMAAKGGPKFKGNGNGDQYVKIFVEIPKKLSREQRALWQELSDSKGSEKSFINKIFN